jgi:hypothetical protein
MLVSVIKSDTYDSLISWNKILHSDVSIINSDYKVNPDNIVYIDNEPYYKFFTNDLLKIDTDLADTELIKDLNFNEIFLNKDFASGIDAFLKNKCKSLSSKKKISDHVQTLIRDDIMNKVSNLDKYCYLHELNFQLYEVIASYISPATKLNAYDVSCSDASCIIQQNLEIVQSFDLENPVLISSKDEFTSLITRKSNIEYIYQEQISSAPSFTSIIDYLLTTNIEDIFDELSTAWSINLPQ